MILAEFTPLGLTDLIILLEDALNLFKMNYGTLFLASVGFIMARHLWHNLERFEEQAAQVHAEREAAKPVALKDDVVRSTVRSFQGRDNRAWRARMKRKGFDDYEIDRLH